MIVSLLFAHAAILAHPISEPTWREGCVDVSSMAIESPVDNGRRQWVLQKYSEFPYPGKYFSTPDEITIFHSKNSLSELIRWNFVGMKDVSGAFIIDKYRNITMRLIIFHQNLAECIKI